MQSHLTFWAVTLGLLADGIKGILSVPLIAIGGARANTFTTRPDPHLEG